jgi:predicted TIM-barrel fold metal-dependent hydrolase
LLPIRSFSRAAGRPVLGLTVAAVLWVAASPLPAQQSLSIEEYTPRSTLVVATHQVARARFPVIDIHSHHPAPLAPAAWSAIAGEIDGINVRVLVNLSGGSGESLRRAIDVIEGGPHKGRMVFFANVDFAGIGQPGWAARAAAALEADVKAGAMGLKIFKNFGLRVSRNGTRVPVDDPELDPIWRTCARLQIPVLIHTGEPAPFFEPVDRHNERWLELNIHPGRRVPPTQYPTFEALMDERDRLFVRHGDTVFIAAHMGWHANDLGKLGRMLDLMPNVRVETGAILAELGRQPRAAHDFFVKYQDRILFGKDTYEASEYPYYWRTFETRDEYFDYYRHYHAFWKLYGMGLPDDVLRKVYYANALSLLPKVPRAWFPAPTAAMVR